MSSTMSATLLILLSLAFASNGCSFGKRDRTRTHHRSDDKCVCTTAVRYNPLTDANVTIDPHCDCRSSGFGVVRMIPYGTCVAADACGITHVDLSSACVRCGMCVAVAEEINQTLLEIHDMMAPDDWLNETEIVLLLRTICDHSFRHYGLREIDGKRFISDPLPGDRLVASSADGLWEKNLRNMCHNYLNEIQEVQLYRNWKEWCEDDEHIPNLEDILCRNEISSLRDCRGIGNVYRRQLSTKIFSARVKLLAEYI
ncbi:PREDICTED: uncharacterized protein LOC105456103 isoform X2 [Wasmannia auropunctata]|uniref:uncharacterized protein LOC105456103 isoform X2 n=1 Tax=Wasmannia auropunctata TaxID=64793 RepID=UPI0005F0896E|nr:PREDICTED: uncharacterized protein LOC105456103 isoform X2 [Wasmannia auropunctata]